MAKKSVQFSINPLLSGPSLKDRAKSGSPYRELNISDIDVDPDQPRRDFEPQALAELAASIKEHGVLSPILVRIAAGGTFRIVAGERRFRAAKLAGLQTIPAVIDSEEQEERTLAKQLVENLQRMDLNPLERALAIGRLRDTLRLSIRDIAAQLGVSKAFVQRSLEVLSLPEDLKVALREGAAESKVLLLGTLNEENQRRALLKRLNELTRSQLEREIARLSGKKEGAYHRGTTERSEEVEEGSIEDTRIAGELQQKLGTKVRLLRIRGAKGQGRLLIEFYSDDDLREIYRRLTE